MKVECKNCNGSGSVSLGEGIRGIKKCNVCDGTGKVELGEFDKDHFELKKDYTKFKKYGESLERRNINLKLSELDLKYIKYAIDILKEKVDAGGITTGSEECQSLEYVLNTINNELGIQIFGDGCEHDDNDLIYTRKIVPL